MRSAASVVLVMAAAAGCDAGGEVDAVALEGLAVPAAVQRGAGLFIHHCAVCHGERGLGSETGPPLVHPVYRPAHHGDEAFQMAVERGVRAHHWRFGDMPAVPGLTREDVAETVRYVRWLQESVGIR